MFLVRVVYCSWALKKDLSEKSYFVGCNLVCRRGWGLEPPDEGSEVVEYQELDTQEREGWTQIGTQTLGVDDPELARLVKVWGKLPEHVRQSIAMLARGWKK